MFEVLITKKSRKLEDEAIKSGFSRVFFIDGKEILLLKAGNKDELRREISRAHSKKQKIVVMGSDDEMNRIAVSDKRVSMLLSPEAARRRDFMHYRDSGLNHVLCNLAKENGVAIGISFSGIRSLKGIQRAEAIGRIMQNVELCRKYGAKIVLASFSKKPSDYHALRSFGLSIGMTPGQAKESLESAESFLG